MTYSEKGNMLHRNQFYCCSMANNAIFPGWQSHSFDKRIVLNYHPNLPWTIKENSKFQIGLLGFSVNPFHNESEVGNTLFRLLEHELFSIPFFKEIDHLSGIFTIWVYDKTKERLYVFPDNGSLAETYFKIDKDNLWIASQVKLLNKLIELNKRAEFKKGGNQNYKLNPVSQTPYKNVYKLIPNHYYSATTAELKRYFPYQQKQEVSFDTALHTLTSHCQRTISLFYEKYKISIPITGGWDSRVLLACSKGLEQDILYFTVMRNGDENNADISTALNLASKANINYRLFAIPDRSFPNWEEVFNKSIDNPRTDMLSSLINCVYNTDLKNILVLTGTTIETAKKYFVDLEDINENHLVKLADIGESDFIRNSFKIWLENSESKILEMGYNVADIFHWEQNVGGIVAKNSSEKSISEIIAICPAYNCKFLIKTLLGLDEKYRGKYDNKLFETLIENEWPELNTIPINPTIKDRAIRMMVRLGLYDDYRRLKLKLL